MVEVRPVPFDDPVARALVRDLVAELEVRYDDRGAGGAPLAPQAFAPPTGTFVLLILDGLPSGCGGIRPHGPGAGEVKRMYVAPAARGRGLGRALLTGLEDAGRALGLTRLVLETGDAQPEAVALYRSAGWTQIPSYGQWRDSPRSLCFGRDLGGGVADR